jgi:hypothetical protein
MMSKFRMLAGIGFSAVVLVALFVLMPSDEKLAFKLCSDKVAARLKSPSSFRVVSDLVSLPMLLPKNDLVKTASYRNASDSGRKVRLGLIPSDDILYDFHIRQGKKATFWSVQSEENRLWHSQVFIDYDADNSFGATIRDSANCQIIWSGESLRSANRAYGGFDVEKPEVSLAR